MLHWLLYFIRLARKKLKEERHSSLFDSGDSDNENLFYKIDNICQCYKTFLLSNKPECLFLPSLFGLV